MFISKRSKSTNATYTRGISTALRVSELWKLWSKSTRSLGRGWRVRDCWLVQILAIVVAPSRLQSSSGRVEFHLCVAVSCALVIERSCRYSFPSSHGAVLASASADRAVYCCWWNRIPWFWCRLCMFLLRLVSFLSCLDFTQHLAANPSRIHGWLGIDCSNILRRSYGSLASSYHEMNALKSKDMPRSLHRNTTW